MAFCFTPDGKCLLMGQPDGLLEWDINQGKSVGEWQIGHTPESIAIASDGSWAAVGDTNDESKSSILARIDLKQSKMCVGSTSLFESAHLCPDQQRTCVCL